jgi:hypothetical protein
VGGKEDFFVFDSLILLILLVPHRTGEGVGVATPFEFSSKLDVFGFVFVWFAFGLKGCNHILKTSPRGDFLDGFVDFVDLRRFSCL